MNADLKLTAILLLLLIAPCLAQERSINLRGRVVDANTGEPTRKPVCRLSRIPNSDIFLMCMRVIDSLIRGILAASFVTAVGRQFRDSSAKLARITFYQTG